MSKSEAFVYLILSLTVLAAAAWLFYKVMVILFTKLNESRKR